MLDKSAFVGKRILKFTKFLVLC